MTSTLLNSKTILLYFSHQCMILICIIFLIIFLLILIRFLIIKFISCFSHVKDSHKKTNFVHQLYRVQAIKNLLIENFKNLLTAHQYNKYITKQI